MTKAFIAFLLLIATANQLQAQTDSLAKDTPKPSGNWSKNKPTPQLRGTTSPATSPGDTSGNYGNHITPGYPNGVPAPANPVMPVPGTVPQPGSTPAYPNNTPVSPTTPTQPLPPNSGTTNSVPH